MQSSVLIVAPQGCPDSACAFDALYLSVRHSLESMEIVALQNAYRCVLCFTLLPFCVSIGSECECFKLQLAVPHL